MSVITDPDGLGSHSSLHHKCLLCGAANPRSLGLRFNCDEAGATWCELLASPALQGYLGMVHGGVVSSLLDAAMTHCLFHHGIEAVTGDLHVRYVQPVSCTARLRVEADLISAQAPLFLARGRLFADGTLVAWAEGKFVRAGKMLAEFADAAR